MTDDDDARVTGLLGRLADGDSKELFRRLLEQGMQELIDAELTAAIGAGPHERTDTRSNQRNGTGSRLLSTPARDVELRIPKVRVGSFFPSLLEPRRRVDKALWGVTNAFIVNPGRNTSKITPVAHPRVDPYCLHQPTGHELQGRRQAGGDAEGSASPKCCATPWELPRARTLPGSATPRPNRRTGSQAPGRAAAPEHAQILRRRRPPGTGRRCYRSY
jgi:hypothetical protein